MKNQFRFGAVQFGQESVAKFGGRISGEFAESISLIRPANLVQRRLTPPSSSNPNVQRRCSLASIPVRNSYLEIASDSLIKSGVVRLGPSLLCVVFIKHSKNDFMLWRICPNGITTQFNPLHRNDFCSRIQQYADRLDMSAHYSGK